jgi:translation initiation factor 2 gamma subunit (eIF-2gamma)
MSSANIHLDAARLHVFSLLMKGAYVMKLARLLNFSAGLVAGTILLAASAQAAPVPPISGQAATVPTVAVEPAVVSQNEVDQMKPVQVRWHHHHGYHRHWHHHRWHRHHWHHRHWRHHRHW